MAVGEARERSRKRVLRRRRLNCFRAERRPLRLLDRVGRQRVSGGSGCGDGAGAGGRESCAAGSRSDSFEEARHPHVPDCVFERRAVDVAVELLCVFLHSGPPVVLYFVISPSRKTLCYFGPPARTQHMIRGSSRFRLPSIGSFFLQEKKILRF